MKPTEADTTRNAILCAFWMKSRKEFVELTTDETSRRCRVPLKVLIAHLPHMDGMIAKRREKDPVTFVLTAAGKKHVLDLMVQKAKPKPQAKQPPQPPEPVRIIEDEREYAKALAQIARMENAAAYKAGRIAVYKTPAPRGSALSQLEARVLVAIEAAPNRFTATSIAAAIDCNRPQVAVAIKELQNKGRITLTRQDRATYSLEASPAGREMPKSEISDQPQPKRAVRVVEAYMTANHSAAENAHVNRISLPAETWAAE